MEPFSISANQVSEKDIDQKLDQLCKTYTDDSKFENFWDDLIDWIKKESDTEVDGFDDIEIVDPNTKMYLPTPDYSKERKLLIYTWGKKIHNNCPKKIEKNFNAAVLHGNKRGVNLKKFDGRSESVQNAVMRSKMFYDFMEAMIIEIEKYNLSSIGINCAKGRHRSVACAELLKKHYYKYARIEHIEL